MVWWGGGVDGSSISEVDRSMIGAMIGAEGCPLHSRNPKPMADPEILKGHTKGQSPYGNSPSDNNSE